MGRHRSRNLWSTSLGATTSHRQSQSIAEQSAEDSPARTMKRWDSFGSWDSNMSLHDSVLECAPLLLPATPRPACTRCMGA